MRKYSLLLAVMLAASFSTVADAAKKKAGGVAADPILEWNVKNMPPQQASTGAAEPAKKAHKAKKHASMKKAKKAKG